MRTLEELATNEEIKKEYKKTFLLNLFKKIVCRMDKDVEFRRCIKTLFQESTDQKITTKAVIRKNLSFEITDEDATVMLTWFSAYLKKSGKRLKFTEEFKKKLCKQQDGRCMVCGEPLGTDLSKIHVDHIIPWCLVGDELKDNYQCLCSFCNESKSAHTDYIFKNLINLI